MRNLTALRTLDGIALQIIGGMICTIPVPKEKHQENYLPARVVLSLRESKAQHNRVNIYSVKTMETAL